MEAADSVLPTTEMNIFYAADTLNMTLHQVDSRIRGSETKMVQLGYWTLNAEVIVVSDVVRKECASFFIRFNKALWGYLCIQGPIHYLLIFDGDELKMKPQDAVSYCTGAIDKTVDKIKKAVKATFVFDAATTRWSRFTDASSEAAGMDAQ